MTFSIWRHLLAVSVSTYSDFRVQRWEAEQVFVAISEQGHQYEDVLVDAIRLVNAADVGAPQLLLTDGQADVEVVFVDMPFGRRMGGCHTENDADVLTAAFIEIRGSLPEGRIQAVTVHELLHALGLHHSRHPDSTMLREPTEIGGGLSEIDVRALEFLYSSLAPGDGPIAVRRALTMWEPTPAAAPGLELD